MLVVDIHRASTLRLESSYFLVCLSFGREGRCSEGLAAWGRGALSCLRTFFGQCSEAISGRSVWQGILVSFYLTLSAAWIPVPLKHQRLNFSLQRAAQVFCGYNQALGWVGQSIVRGAVSVPFQCSLPQCAAPLQHRSGPLLGGADEQSFNWVGVNVQENTKTNRNPRNATSTLQSQRFFKRSAQHLR